MLPPLQGICSPLLDPLHQLAAQAVISWPVVSVSKTFDYTS